ncbi:MAG TPA: SIS domain-containing protein [Thermoanaerobacterales bacterium]|nr:SIS domain-containing protein [Thermoanaerobacterales bacterium]
MVTWNYLDFVTSKIQKIKEAQEANIKKAAELIAGSIMNGGNFYVFGTGHSHIIAEDIYLRAGGLALIKAILEPALMIHEFPVNKSTHLERLNGYGAALIKLYKIKPGDVLLIASNSGRNAVVVEMALESRKMGCKVVALTSLLHAKNVLSRHESGLRLFETADVVLDNCTEYGDAAFNIRGLDTPIGPTSSITGAAIVQALVVTVTDILIENGYVPPVFKSSNMDGADEYNNELFEKYYGMKSTRGLMS